jgi:hypothetical protein
MVNRRVSNPGGSVLETCVALMSTAQADLQEPALCQTVSILADALEEERWAEHHIFHRPPGSMQWEST